MWEFADQHTFAFLLLALLIAVAVESIALRVWSRLMRHLNIRSKGWPPSHLDADGDFKTDGKRDG